MRIEAIEMHVGLTLLCLVLVQLSSVVHSIKTEELKASGELRFYPSGKVSRDKDGRTSKLTVNLQAKKKHVIDKLKKINTDLKEKCSAFNVETPDHQKCSFSDNFGENSDYFCFFLKLEKIQHWKPRGFTKTPFLPEYNETFIPVTCYLTAGYRFGPLDKYERPVQLWPQSGFPLSFFSAEKRPKECSPLVTGVIDDPVLFENYFEYRKLQCKVWDFAKLKQNRVTVFLNVKGSHKPSHNVSLFEAAESNAIPLIPESTDERNNTHEQAADEPVMLGLNDLTEFSAKEDPEETDNEYLARRDPSVPVQSMYEELDLDVPASK